MTERDQQIHLRPQAIDLGLHGRLGCHELDTVRVVFSRQPARAARVCYADHPYPQPLRIEYDTLTQRRSKLRAIVCKVTGEHREIGPLPMTASEGFCARRQIVIAERGCAEAERAESTQFWFAPELAE